MTTAGARSSRSSAGRVTRVGNAAEKFSAQVGNAREKFFRKGSHGREKRQRAPSPRIGRALQEVRMQRRAGRRGCRAAGRRSPATITDRRSASRTCRPVDYIGGTRPFLPANTRSAVNAPSEFRLATTKTCTPGCRSPDSPGSMATMGMPAGMAIVCEPPEAPSLYRSINDDPACLDTVPFVIFDVVTMPFVILEATAVPLVILLPRETPGQSQP